MCFQVQRLTSQGVRKMKTLISVAILTIAFLSAGAFADQPVQTPKTNITVAYKNQAWPVKGQIVIQACKINRCTNI
jgi:hypothetical protein